MTSSKNKKRSIEKEFRKNSISELIEKYPMGYSVDWDCYVRLAESIRSGLPIDIFYKLYPITTTYTLRRKYKG